MEQTWCSKIFAF